MIMARKPKAAPIAPALPPPTEADIAAERDITVKLQQMVKLVRQRNLDNAVALAQQAARGQGPLIDHFCELGRRFGDALNTPPKPKLKVVKGGAS